MELFMEFVNRQQREARRHLQLVEKLLKQNHVPVKGHLEADEPYLFVGAGDRDLSFEGVRIYKIGNTLAYRVAKEEKTEPYGTAYPLNLDDMFNDFMSENDMKEEEAGKKVVESVVGEIKKFFERSAAAEKELKKKRLDDGGIVLRTGGTDYSSLIFNST